MEMITVVERTPGLLGALVHTLGSRLEVVRVAARAAVGELQVMVNLIWEFFGT